MQLLQESKPGVEISIVETADSMCFTVESAEWSGEKNGATMTPPMPLAPDENWALYAVVWWSYLPQELRLQSVDMSKAGAYDGSYLIGGATNGAAEQVVTMTIKSKANRRLTRAGIPRGLMCKQTIL